MFILLLRLEHEEEGNENNFWLLFIKLYHPIHSTFLSYLLWFPHLVVINKCTK